MTLREADRQRAAADKKYHIFLRDSPLFSPDRKTHFLKLCLTSFLFSLGSVSSLFSFQPNFFLFAFLSLFPSF